MPGPSPILRFVVTASAASVLLLASCDDGGGHGSSTTAENIYSVANSCRQVTTGGVSIGRNPAATGFDLGATATPFFFKASGLGTYLLYDEARGYLVSDGSMLLRETTLESDLTTLDDSFQSEAEWELQAVPDEKKRFRLKHRKSGNYLAADGMAASASEAASVTLEAADGCAEFPEEKTWTEGSVKRSTFEDGAVYGFVDAHSHILANYGFGGGGIFHGAPFHPLGVERALPSCEKFHGVDGRKDFFGYGYDSGGDINVDLLIQSIASGELPRFNHSTAGYPDFTTWPSGPHSSTHQVQYYKWLERAYLGGLRLVVQHAVSNQMICDFLGNGHIQPIRYSCNDMVAVDREIEEVFRMQDYIDAQEGGPGRGWFRVVRTPAEAREVIASGKMAVVLGIETSNVLDCFLRPSAEHPACTEQDVINRLDDYFDRGVRAIFPVHKFDNGFSAGDGMKAFIELGNFIQTGNFNHFTEECEDVPTVFDGGPMLFPGLNKPRENYLSPAPYDLSHFYDDPLRVLGPFLGLLLQPGTGSGNSCQQFGLTALGEHLIRQMMLRGMILEVDHLPRKSYRRAYELLVENDYPASGSHGLDNRGVLYQLGGVSTSGFSSCRSATERATVDDGFQNRLHLIREKGGYPGLGFGLDLNGFAGAQGPRFGERSHCGDPQTDPVTYPFTSFAGDVTFDRPQVGNRLLDFNTEGLVHIGLLPDLIEDVRRDGVTDAEIEPLFRSAEAYLRMWEKAERRGAELRAAAGG